MTNTILLADDSVTIQKVIELTFMDEDYEVVAVGNGDEALDRLEEVTPDVVIADVHMPGASGYDVARRAKQLHPQAPVLLLVGTFEPFDEADYQGSGADGYLKKPFDSQELLHRVSELMEARAGVAEPAAPSPAAAVPTAASAAEGVPSGPLADAVAPPATAAAPSHPQAPAPAAGEETRFVPVWNEEAAPSDEAAEEGPEPFGTRRIPTFGGDEPPAPTAGAAATAGGEEPEWSSWGLSSEPEEVPSPAPAEEAEPAWPAGEPFQPEWESFEARGPEEEAETPSWALEETDEQASGGEPVAEATATPPPSAPAFAAPGPSPAAETRHPAETQHPTEPFPELARPQPAAPATALTATEAASVAGGGPAEAPPAAVAGNGPESRLSEEDVDRVARRVAELLGDRVIREVAWEVVPDLAEVVIKDRLRELESQVD
jgi:CheY-like chemotaxis protein